jgi:amino acid transporter
LINVGSTLALLILISLVNSALIASYTITILCILFHRLKGGKLLQTRFSLGKWGALINVLALVYVLPIFVFSFFPAAPKPVPSTMNWAIMMLGGPIIFATAYYFLGGKRIYTPPEETVDDYIVRYEGTTKSENEMSSGIADVKAASSTVADPIVDGAEKLD